MSDPNAGGPNPGPPKGSVAAVAITMALLAVLVWFLNPRQPDFKPAPLKPPSAECLKPGREFVPSNLTSIDEPAVNSLADTRKMATIYRVNTTPCTCGCQYSLAYCRATNLECAVSGPAIKQMAAEANQKADRKPEKK